MTDDSTSAPAKSPWPVLLPVLVGIGALLIGLFIGGAGGFTLGSHLGNRGGIELRMPDRGPWHDGDRGDRGDRDGGPRLDGPFSDRQDVVPAPNAG